MTPSKWEFLKSIRFWNLVIVAIVVVLKKQGIIIDDTLVDTVSQIIAIILGGSTVLRTVDRVSEKIGAGGVQVKTGNVENQSISSPATPATPPTPPSDLPG